jgi:hypothetical protein
VLARRAPGRGLRGQSPALAPGPRRRLDPNKANSAAQWTDGVLSCSTHVVKLRCRCGGFRSLHSVTVTDHCLPSAWNVSWNGALDNPRAASAVSAMMCAIGAAGVLAAWGRASCKRQVSGSIPLTGSQVRGGSHPLCALSAWNGL